MTLPMTPRYGQPAPETVYGYVSARSLGGVPMTEATHWDSAQPFHADAESRQRAEDYAEAAGLTITAESRLGFAVSGPPEAYEELTGGRIETYEALRQVEMDHIRYVTQLDIVGDRQPEARGVGDVPGTDAIEAVALESPRTPARLVPSAQPPNVDKFHLRLPGDVAMLLGATRAHARGEVGAGVPVAMVDTGQFPHTYFSVHGYDVRPTVAVLPGTSPVQDPIGHGTGESANIFAVAPGAELHPYRASDNHGSLTGAYTAFIRAKADRPQVLTNSWGGARTFPPVGPPSPNDNVFALEIQDALEQGITVVFSAMNGQFAMEPQVPGVLSVGGVYVGPGLELRASDYASGYASPWFEGVVVPVVSGLVGMRPRAQYLMLPVPPGCALDVSESRAQLDGRLPDPGDGTAEDDGWALFSGTSAAAPQVAGAAAVLLGARPGLTPAQVIEALVETAVDVTIGTNHPRFNRQARFGPDEATGAGLVNVDAALSYVRDHFP
ncbi:S8 family serine peptidase [Streptomyces ipomoeae]|uniref:Peptidase families S8 and S53 n=2 Tax=Streptomyces ipomoeae TaxID=103232 RepID=L1KM68_9ACTN|nr:S8 family serine peptidase [Streptomyces ipomoeae]EKX61692.1 peptidase families S8 and S53 [Streptomyces ipomoeae 91-03]MDX2692889.1 S8 family serine peptidase [Streptomyces ipomoeae]MDX2820190.1 S8 family serine peptidase [Streptomyces ipomoeae]MDX2840003.1 S8 family serine peptidase [Streptomyces ipomoeae]MDX2875378.1 S8 family serine peptidase [Streptomyces ipomoeae]